MKAEKSFPTTSEHAQHAMPRFPTATEKADLLAYLLASIDIEKYAIDAAEAASAQALIDAAYISVYETYAADSAVGYSGKLMSVVWSISPLDHDVFTWPNGALEEPKMHHDLL